MNSKSTTSIPEPGEGKRGERGHLGYLLRQAYAASRLATERALHEFGVTPPQFMVMTMINAYPGASSADVARLAMLTPQTISLIVANLERAGRLSRSIDPAHGRIQRMVLTDEGQDLLARCRERTNALEDQLTAELSPDDDALIRRWLVSVAARPASLDDEPLRSDVD